LELLATSAPSKPAEKVAEKPAAK